MHELEQRIAEWPKAMMAAPNVGQETIEGL
jgi:hypothetical protein